MQSNTNFETATSDDERYSRGSFDSDVSVSSTVSDETVISRRSSFSSVTRSLSLSSISSPSSSSSSSSQILSALSTPRLKEDDQQCSREALVSMISCILQRLWDCDETRISTETSKRNSSFHAQWVFEVPIDEYFMWIVWHTKPGLDNNSPEAGISNEALVLSLIYLNQIKSEYPSFEFNRLTMHRLLLCSMLCAAKFLDDCCYDNEYYAEVGGVSIEELNNLEIEFLALLKNSLRVKSKDYKVFYDALRGEGIYQGIHQNCHCKFRSVPPLPEQFDDLKVHVMSRKV